jgi:hypothetical protein
MAEKIYRTASRLDGLNGYVHRGDNFSPRMPCQWYARGGGEGERRILIGQSVPPTPFGMAFGRLKLSPQESVGVFE